MSDTQTNPFTVRAGSLADCVAPKDFPAWFFAEIVVASEPHVVSIFHVRTPSGIVPYWYEDPENQHRGLPLLKSMKPSLLGDYGSFLALDNNMQLFVSLCKALDDLPDPLIGVQVIRWMSRRQNTDGVDGASLADFTKNAMAAVTQGIERRRAEFEQVMSYITGNKNIARQ